MGAMMPMTRQDSMLMTIMIYDPATGEPHPSPSYVEDWRYFNPHKAWIYNPWTGNIRSSEEIYYDPVGYEIVPPAKIQARSVPTDTSR